MSSVKTHTAEEIKVALKMLRKGKAAGADQIIAGMLKADLDQTSQELKQTFDQIWKEENMLKKWTK